MYMYVLLHVFMHVCIYMLFKIINSFQSKYHFSFLNVTFLSKYHTTVHFKRLGSRVFHDSFKQYVFFFSKQCTYRKTNVIYT